jgi:DinB superfamily
MHPLLLALALLPPPNPVAAAIRHALAEAQHNLIAAAEAMPDSGYRFRPTPQQMRFGEIVQHVAESNDWGCGIIGGLKPPKRSKLSSPPTKAALVAELRDSFEFCDRALGPLTDDSLAATVWTFPNDPMSRARAIIGVAGDWEDHYAQMAIYLRLNGVRPPTAATP